MLPIIFTFIFIFAKRILFYDIIILHIFMKFSKTEDNFFYSFFQNIHTFKMSITDGCVKRLVTKYVRENNLSFVLSVIPENITNHHNLELLTLTKKELPKLQIHSILTRLNIVN